MSNVEKKKEKPTEEKIGQVKPQQVRLKHRHCVVKPQPHSRIAALQIHRELAVVASMHNEGPEGPHGESSASCVTCTVHLVNQT